MAISCVDTTTRGGHICFQTIDLFVRNFANGLHFHASKQLFLRNVVLKVKVRFTHVCAQSPQQ
jgi:hypothetical protein